MPSRPEISTDGTSPPVAETALETDHTEQLRDDELSFLKLVTAHPDLPVSALYAEFGASVWKANKLRQQLVGEGYLVELETRRGKRGRLAKYLVPTARAIELVPAELPPGRGSPLHRHVQQLVVAEAREKGYRASIEHELLGGGIVDVHVAGETGRVAVEISITSPAGRELDHIRDCLEAGYERVVALVFSESIANRLRERLPEVELGEAKQKVEILDVRQVGTLFR